MRLNREEEGERGGLWLELDRWRARYWGCWWICLSRAPFFLLPPLHLSLPPAWLVDPWRGFADRNSLSPLSSPRLLRRASGFFPAVLCYHLAGNLFWLRSVETITAGKKKKGETGTAGGGGSVLKCSSCHGNHLYPGSPHLLTLQVFKRLARLIDRCGKMRTHTHAKMVLEVIKSAAHLLASTLATDPSLFPVYWDIIYAAICTIPVCSENIIFLSEQVEFPFAFLNKKTLLWFVSGQRHTLSETGVQ